eukprot:scaffold296406_cov28-Attheya_sp.AAC.1
MSVFHVENVRLSCPGALDTRRNLAKLRLVGYCPSGASPRRKKQNNPESGYKTRKKKRTLCTGSKKYDNSTL